MWPGNDPHALGGENRWYVLGCGYVVGAMGRACMGGGL